MEDIYRKLGFKKPNILENNYGIRIHVGTKGKADWCVEVPKRLHNGAKLYEYDKNFTFYLVTEEHALEIAEKYTELAKQYKR